MSRVLAGPYCTMVLADLGADVIKVERPGEGDETRSWGPPYAGSESAYYLSINRSKRSVALDLKDARALELAAELCAGADVVVENFRAGAADAMGLRYDALSARNEQIVYCSITGFGAERPAPAPARAGLRFRGPGGVGAEGDPGRRGADEGRRRDRRRDDRCPRGGGHPGGA